MRSVLGGAIGLVCATPMVAQEAMTHYGFYGNPGLLDMPTAEVAPDGELSLSYNRFDPMRRTTLTFQITPKLSGSFSYTGTDNLTDEFDIYWDRTFDLSYQIVEEKGCVPPSLSACAISLEPVC